MASAEQPFNEREQVRESLHRRRGSRDLQVGLNGDMTVWIQRRNEADPLEHTAQFFGGDSQSLLHLSLRDLESHPTQRNSTKLERHGFTVRCVRFLASKN